jgi:hypothetical protein
VPAETRSSASEVARIREQVARIMGRAAVPGDGDAATLVDPIERLLHRRARRQGLLLMAVSAVIMVALIYAGFHVAIRAL